MSFFYIYFKSDVSIHLKDKVYQNILTIDVHL